MYGDTVNPEDRTRDPSIRRVMAAVSRFPTVLTHACAPTLCSGRPSSVRHGWVASRPRAGRRGRADRAIHRPVALGDDRPVGMPRAADAASGDAAASASAPLHRLHLPLGGPCRHLKPCALHRVCDRRFVVGLFFAADIPRKLLFLLMRNGDPHIGHNPL